MMAQHRGGSFPRAVPLTRLVPPAVCLGLLLLGAAWVPAASAAAGGGWTPDPVSWTNGVVLCEFVSNVPGVNVSASNLSDSGLRVGLEGMSEIDPAGAVVASANFSGATWQMSNLSNDDDYILEFAASAPIARAPSGAAPVGSVDVAIDFILPAYAEDGAAVNVVTAQLTISNWTWQTAGDSLQILYSAGPAYPGSEHLASPSQPGWLFASVSNHSGQPLEWMQPDPNATAWGATGAPANVSATAAVAIRSPSSGTVTVDLDGSGAGYNASRFLFDSEIGIVLPSTVAGLPLADFVAVAGIGLVASLAIAGVARRVRRRPSRLIYVDGEGT